MGQSFLPIVFESQGLAGKMFLQHLDKLITQRADKIGAPVAPLKIYWSRRLSLTLQRSVAQAINIRWHHSTLDQPVQLLEMKVPGRESLQGKRMHRRGIQRGNAKPKKAKEKERKRDLWLLISLFFKIYFSFKP